MTDPAARPLPVVLNTGSRRGAEARPQVEGLLSCRHDMLDLRTVDDGAQLAGALDELMATRPELLVVGGGDGTIGSAAERLAGTGTALGVLPLGTANDFARSLEVPTALESAVATLTDGHVVDVDLGRVDGAAFLNVASLGLSVGVTQRLTPRLKQRLGPLAYPVATLRAYRGHTGFSASLEFPDGDQDTLQLDDLMQVAVGNGVHYGGGNTVSPTASLDDHLLDVYAIVRGKMSEHVPIARLLRSGHFIHHDRVHHLTTRRVHVVTDPPMPVNTDGEVSARTPATFTVERNVLHVVVPVSSRAARLDTPQQPRSAHEDPS